MLKRLMTRVGRKTAVELGILLEGVQDDISRATLPRFATSGDVLIRLPREIRNPQNIRLGDRVRLGPNSVLKANSEFPGSWLAHPDGNHRSQTFSPSITIGNGVTATASLQVVAFDEITIEDDVMFAGNVFISDGTHGYSEGDVPYKYQGIEHIAPIRIGRGSWIGQNAVILPGVNIGRQCIIGANSVVRDDVEDGSIAVGSPARMVRSWDAEAKRWGAVSTTRVAGS